MKSLASKTFPHERLFAGYMILLAIIIVVAGAPLDDRWIRLLLHLVFAGVLLFVFPLLGETGWKGITRLWLPIALVGFVYTELDVLNDLFTAQPHDAAIVALEEKVFRTQWAVSLRQWLPWRPVSEYLHFSYFSYYFLFPVLGIALCRKGKFEEYRYAATATLAAFFLCYTIFIFYPVVGPWNYFTRPTLDEVGFLAPALVHKVLIAGESVGTAFPSSHVAAALTIWLAAYRLDRKVFWFEALLVPTLILGTMYGGFHYGVDVVVGIAAGLFVTALAPSLHRLLGGAPPIRIGSEKTSPSNRTLGEASIS